MAFMSLNDYLQRVQGSLYQQNGEVLAELISFRDPHVMSSRLMVEKPERDVERVIDASLAEVIAGHLRAAWAAGSGDTVEAWRTQMVVVQAVARFMQDCKEENWMLPVMYTSCLDLRLFALAADQELTRTGASKAGETLEKAAEALMSCFRICAADTRTSEDCTKRWGLLYLVNQFFKIYFKINKLNLCKPMVRAIEALSFKDRFSLSQLITYKYYTGRKDMFDSDFQSADATLSFAFQRCHVGSRKNKRRILIYLIPVKMLRGYLPKPSVLERYNLPEFQDVVTSVRQGNVKLLSETLARHESFFIGAGIYLILEKLKILAFRNLFKKVFLMSGTHQIDITLFLRALQWMCVEDVDLDETECILSNMINDGRIKGYISHAHRKVVVSKKDPFPPLTSC
ncbi:PCI domain-containing protein 2-like isoform X1 [Portunus trituberculatus]|nr:PCI domain-containing protein 2-like isoform X1 [Portunus trituberculatus]XP_045128000.1 PCI domain-containing protein 2-like isoform X1 [Portunus trituberculatus]